MLSALTPVIMRDFALSTVYSQLRLSKYSAIAFIVVATIDLITPLFVCCSVIDREKAIYATE